MSTWHGLDPSRSFDYRDGATKEEKHQLYRDCYDEAERLLAQWHETRMWWVLGEQLIRLKTAIRLVVEAVGPPPELQAQVDNEQPAE